MPGPGLRAPGSLCHTASRSLVSPPDELRLCYRCFNTLHSRYIQIPDVVTGQRFLLLRLKLFTVQQIFFQGQALLSRFSRLWLCVTPSLGFSRQEHWSGLPLPSMHKSEKWKWSRSVMSDSSRPHGLQPTRLLHPWDFPGKSTGVGCHCLLRGTSSGFHKCCYVCYWPSPRQFLHNHSKGIDHQLRAWHYLKSWWRKFHLWKLCSEFWTSFQFIDLATCS